MKRLILTVVLVMVSIASVWAQDVATLVSQGNEQLAEAQFTDALATFEQAYALDPNSFDVTMGLHRVYTLMRPLAGAVRQENTELYLRRALELSPDAEEAQVALARWTGVYGDRNEAISQLEAVLQANPSSVAALIQLARLRVTEDTALARPLLDQALALAPDNSELWIVEGLYELWANNDRYAEIEALNRAIELDPRNWQAYSNRATAFWFTNQWDRMLRDLRVLEPRWADPLTYSNLALAMLNLGMFADGAAAGQRAIDIALSIGETPNMVQTDRLAENLVALGDYEAAAAVWDSYYAIPGNIDRLLNMDNAAMVYYRAGQFERALEFFERKSTEGSFAIYKTDHEAAFEQLPTCAAAGCPLPEPTHGVLTSGNVAGGSIGYRQSVWSFEGSAGQRISAAVTVTQPVEVELIGFSADGTAYPIWSARATATRPFVLQNMALPADATYRIRIYGDDGVRYRILVNQS